MNILASSVIDLLDGNKATAAFFGVTPGAVSQWRYGGLPPARELELMRRKPDVYVAAMRAAEQKAAA